MTENMKKFLELVSKDEALQAKLKEMEGKTQEEIQKTTMGLAAEQGIMLKEDDFNREETGELSEDELETVVGGGKCYCAFVGGGSGETEKGSWWCGCYSQGLGFGGSSNNCYCPVGGYGRDV